MKKVVENKIVPEHEVTVIKYLSFDGKEFFYADECDSYEKYLRKQNEIMSHISMKTKVDIDFDPDTVPQSFTLFYIPSDKEYQFLIDNLQPGKAYVDEYKKFGPGFYLYCWEDGGDGPVDHYELYQVDNYFKRIEHDYETWRGSIEQAMSNIKNNYFEISDSEV